MCNRYASDIRKAGLEKEFYGFDEWSETRINPVLGNAVLEVFPKSFGPVVKLGDTGELQWAKMRWGLLGPPQFGGAPVTNIRNVKSAHWRPLLGAAHRCIVPFTAFSEYEDASPKGKKVIRWFAPPSAACTSSLASGANGLAITARRRSPTKARTSSLAS
jgi:putative SOS response-associated peptidase YedK